MNAYTWMMAIVLLLALVMRGNKKKNKKFIILAVIAMFCLMGLRDITTIGNDSASSYLHTYERIAENSYEDFSIFKDGEVNYNNGFYFAMKLSNDMGFDYQTFIMLISAFILISVGHLVMRYSVSPIQSFCYFWGLLIYMLMFDALKQALAMATIILAFDAIVDKKPIKYILLVLLATTFHFPALAFIPAYWLAKIKTNRSYLILLVAILALTFVFRDQILTFMMKAYKDTEETISMKGVRFLSNKALIMVIIIVAALVLRPPTEEDRVYGILLKFMGIAVVFQTFCGYNNIFERLADYYFQFSIVFIPLVFEKVKLNRQFISEEASNMAKTIAPYVFSGFGIWRFADYINNTGNIYMPFLFYFQAK